MIGRRFVPKGSTANQWNLILWACATCNRLKSDLEDDIAAITMHFHAAGLPAMSDPTAQVEAKRRGQKSGSRKTGKSVANSYASFNSTAQLTPALSMTVGFAAPPQIDNARTYELARLQMLAFFYLLTYESNLNLGHWWPGEFMPIHGTIKSDWGNPVHCAFMKAVSSWDYRLVLNTANDYYRAAIRRHPTSELWSWAVEWNKSYRLIGLLGDPSAAKAFARSLPHVPVHSIREGPNSYLRFRHEEPLGEQEDVLFHMPAEDDE